MTKTFQPICRYLSEISLRCAFVFEICASVIRICFGFAADALRTVRASSFEFTKIVQLKRATTSDGYWEL